MEGKLPHYTTLQKSSTRSNVLAIANALYLKKRGYGKRWHIEFFFSGLKRMMGSAFSSRTDANLLKEAAIRVLAYPLHR